MKDYRIFLHNFMSSIKKTVWINCVNWTRNKQKQVEHISVAHLLFSLFMMKKKVQNKNKQNWSKQRRATKHIRWREWSKQKAINKKKTYIEYNIVVQCKYNEANKTLIDQLRLSDLGVSEKNNAHWNEQCEEKLLTPNKQTKQIHDRLNLSAWNGNFQYSVITDQKSYKQSLFAAQNL